MKRMYLVATARKVFVLIFVLGLAGCSLPPLRDDVSQDGAPNRQLDPTKIAEVVPKPEPIGPAGNTSPYTVLGKTYQILPSTQGYVAEGMGSWYGTKFHGKKTSNGEDYDLYAMTAAHKTLPIPCYVRVTNLENGVSAVVRVNDRGPFHEGRIIDLSYAAATKLGYVDKGTARVRVEAISFPEQKLHYLQVGAFKELSAAQRSQQQFQQRLAQPVRVARGSDAIHRVQIGPLGWAELSTLKTLLAEQNVTTSVVNGCNARSGLRC